MNALTVAKIILSTVNATVQKHIKKQSLHRKLHQQLQFLLVCHIFILPNVCVQITIHQSMILLWILLFLCSDLSSWFQTFLCQLLTRLTSKLGVWMRILFLPHWIICGLMQTACKSIAYISINSLGPSDTTWRQISGSTLAQVMACCLTAPSHYLNKYWLIISKVEWRSSKGKFTKDTSAINHRHYL